jgi:hypothetical protein
VEPSGTSRGVPGGASRPPIGHYRDFPIYFVYAVDVVAPPVPVQLV